MLCRPTFVSTSIVAGDARHQGLGFGRIAAIELGEELGGTPAPQDGGDGAVVADDDLARSPHGVLETLWDPHVASLAPRADEW